MTAARREAYKIAWEYLHRALDVQGVADRDEDVQHELDALLARLHNKAYPKEGAS